MRSAEYYEKYHRIAATVATALVPDDRLSQYSIQDIVKFKENERDTFERFKLQLFELVSLTSSEPWTKQFEDEVMKLIDTRILPDSMKARDQLAIAWEKMFGGVTAKTAAVVTPTMIASFFSGLSAGQILTLSTAAAAGAVSIAVPELVELWKDHRSSGRNGLAFLLKM